MVYDENYNLLQEPVDLTKGYIIQQTRIRADAEPVDDELKFAWEDTDYEDIDIYIPYTAEQLEALNTPSPDEDRDGMLVDMEYRLTILELGL